MKKHNLALTCKDKIEEVRNYECTQTIRPRSDKKPKEVGDYVRFHGWEGRPYRSKWSWRTPYMKIEEVFKAKFIHIPYTNRRKIRLAIGIKLHDGSYFYPLCSEETEERIAHLDGLESFDKLTSWLHDQYGEDMFEQIYAVIRWNPKEVLRDV